MNYKKKVIFSALVLNGLSYAMQENEGSQIKNLLGILATNNLGSVNQI